MTVRAGTRAKFLAAAVTLICRRAVEGVGRMLRPEDLAEEAAAADDDRRGTSRQSAYRVWDNDRDAATIDLVAYVSDPHTSGSVDDLDAAEGEYNAADHMTPDMSTADQQSLFLDVLSVNFERQFAAEPLVVGWMLHTAALTSSPLWQGVEPNPAARAVGAEIIAARGRSFDHIAEIWTGLLCQAMAAFGRRPRSGYDVEAIVRVMHAMFDGALLHMFVDPGLNDPDITDAMRDRRRARAVREASQAMVHLAWAYSEPGSLDDPRRPTRPDVGEMFESLVDRAAELFAGDRDGDVGLDDVAVAAGVAREQVDELFPTTHDLADSVLRRLVAPAGRSLNTNGLTMIAFVLQRLAAAAVSHPRAFAVADEQPPTVPANGDRFVDELTTSIARALPRADGQMATTSATAQELVRRAREGEDWRELLVSLASPN